VSRPLPFVAVVGQEHAKRALLMAAVEPLLGGVLLRGDKGSAKTTLARGLATLLPGDAPFVELPLGAAEDRVLGSIDLTELLANASPSFRPGLLAAAHGGVLYVDEINLLADHLVDALLDVAASGVNRVERDGISHVHPARFVLVASMNPEEGELRPQLLDRFGLSVDVRAPLDVSSRVQAVRRQLSIEMAAGGDADYETATIELRERVDRARRSMASVDDEVLHVASSVALDVGAEGLRADLMLVRAARANAALADRSEATVDDLRKVAGFVLSHRRRRRPFEQPGVDQNELDDAFDRAAPPTAHDATGRATANQDRQAPIDTPDAPSTPDPTNWPDTGTDSVAEDRLDHPDTGVVHHATLPVAPKKSHSGPTGRGGLSEGQRGRTIRTALIGDGRPHPVASAVALATRRAVEATPEVGPRTSDLRSVERENTTSTLVVFVVDASSSMGVEHRMAATKAAVIGLLGDAYRRRCRVALVTFRADRAETVLRPTASVEIAHARLAELRTGGTSPIAAGLIEAMSLVGAAGRDRHASVVLVTDGRASGHGKDPRDAIAAAIDAARSLVRRGIGLVVVDSETGPTRLGFARHLATEAGGSLLPIAHLHELSAPDRPAPLISSDPTRSIT
jgi:magnesium chelatase subunit D